MDRASVSPRISSLLAHALSTGFMKAPMAIALVCFSLFVFDVAQAATIDITVKPKLVYRADGFTVNGGKYPDLWYDTPEAAFAAAKPYWDHCEQSASGKACLSAVNMRPYTNGQHTFNGSWGHFYSDVQTCDSSGCNVAVATYHGAIDIDLTAVCPQKPVGYNEGNPVYFALTQTSSDATGVQEVCTARVAYVLPCSDCNALGNPIHPGTGQKLQVEADYASANSGLQFVRTYRSANGFFESEATQGWVDSSATGIESETCYPDIYSGDGSDTIYGYCYPYVSYLPDGIQFYYLHAANGRVTKFSGHPSTVLANADVNIKVARRLGPSGAAEWWLWDPTQGYEIYDAAGGLLRKTSFDGRIDLRYTRSDSATPMAAAPRPGLAIGIVDQFGRALDFVWDSGARLTGMRDPTGGIFVYAHDGNGNLASVTYPDGVVRSYSYEEANVNGGETCQTPNGLPYAALNQLTGITDENGGRFSTFTYDCIGRALTTEHAGGTNRFTLAYSSSMSTNGVDPLGANRTYNYLEILSVRRPTGQSQPAGSGCSSSASAIVYDGNGNAASVDDFNGSRVCSAYDQGRNLETSRVEGLTGGASGTDCGTVTPANAVLPTGSRKTSTVWHPDWRLAVQVAEPGRLTTSIYNGQPDPTAGGAVASCAPSGAVLPDGKPIAVLCKQVQQATTDTDGHLGFAAALQTGVASRVSNWTYNQYGQVLTERDPLGHTTTYAYYADSSFTGADPNAVGHTMGDLQTVTNAVGQATTYDLYDKNGNLLQSTDPNGVVTANSYDPRQRLLSTTVGGHKTSYTYDAVGQLLQVSQPDGSWIGYEYDAAHRKTATKDSLGNRIELTLDNAGNVTAQNVLDPSGALARTLSQTFDALNRVQQTTGAQ